MTKFLTKGTITAVLSVAAILAGAFGKPYLATFLNDPTTVEQVLVGLGAIGGIVAGAMKGINGESA